jgi:hypothetical protein
MKPSPAAARAKTDRNKANVKIGKGERVNEWMRGFVDEKPDKRGTRQERELSMTSGRTHSGGKKRKTAWGTCSLAA